MTGQHLRPPTWLLHKQKRISRLAATIMEQMFDDVYPLRPGLRSYRG